MTTWADLFDRAAAYDADREAICEALERQRADGSGGVEVDDG